MLMGKEKLCDVDNLLLWAANKQMKLEGGFQVVFLGSFPKSTELSTETRPHLF